jgi:Rps23 Pro-64 3,4-dihydroxylase Tpa1-like proline 4-hydroxylase
MLKNEIVNNYYKKLNGDYIALKKSYINEEPFPNIELKNFFNEEFLNKVLSEFPDLSQKKSENYNNKNEIKFANNDYKNFSPNIKYIFDYLNSEEFILFLQSITSIKEKLIGDQAFNGGGLHEIKRGGLLKIHTDFNRHPSLELDRRLNVLIYLNKDWEESYGGHLQLWDKDMKYCKKKYLPNFNSMVIFGTTDFSNHGHPDPLTCPNDRSRKSLATYYYSDGRPKEEIISRQLKNRTNFKDREGFINETNKKNESFKDFLRRFNFYQSIKKIEKKFFRTGKSQREREKK